VPPTSCHQKTSIPSVFVLATSGPRVGVAEVLAPGRMADAVAAFNTDRGALVALPLALAASGVQNAHQPDRCGLALFGVTSERAEVATFLDRFEDDFYKYMDAAVKDWEAKHEVIGNAA
jgi:hypothetical protein